LHHFSAGFRCVETGYNLHRAHWGKGIITEAMSAVLTYAFMDLDCHRVEAVIDPTNTRSIGLAFKLGFTYEGTLRQRYLGKHGLEDESYYAILKPEWLAKQTSVSRDDAGSLSQ
jgi:[ribosomal protein S5]-alanine N-acetyltransferase